MFFACTAPLLLTWNGAEGPDDEPAKIVGPAPVALMPTEFTPDPAVRELEDSVHPPTVPPVAVMSLVDIVPVTLADVATNEPVLVTRNGAVDAVVPPSHSRYAGSLEERRAMFAPDPTVMSPALEIVVSPPVSDVEERLQPPIEPEVAVTAPVIEALVAVSTPALVTLNGAVDAVEDPAKNGYEAGEIPTAVEPDPAVSDVAPMVNPPI
jgi:hypothetical protein